MKPVKDLELAHEIEQFYFREARMLDNREYQSWMELLAPGIEYTLPARNNNGADVSLKNREEILEISHELSRGLEPPIRDDNMLTLTMRANRPTNPQSWSDNPPVRTRRFVSNVEPYQTGRKKFHVYSNTMMHYSRHGADNHIYSYQRKDELEKIDGDLKIARRKIIIDWNIITAPSLALLF